MDAENSDTPRTDAALDELAEDQRCQVNYNGSTFIDFSRQLEREINELRQQVAHLKSNVSPVDYKRAFEYLEQEMALMIDKAPEYVGVLRRENERLERELELSSRKRSELKTNVEALSEVNTELKAQNERLREALKIIYSRTFGGASLIYNREQISRVCDKALAAQPEEKTK